MDFQTDDGSNLLYLGYPSSNSMQRPDPKLARPAVVRRLQDAPHFVPRPGGADTLRYRYWACDAKFQIPFDMIHVIQVDASKSVVSRGHACALYQISYHIICGLDKNGDGYGQLEPLLKYRYFEACVLGRSEREKRSVDDDTHEWEDGSGVRPQRCQKTPASTTNSSRLTQTYTRTPLRYLSNTQTEDTHSTRRDTSHTHSTAVSSRTRHLAGDIVFPSPSSRLLTLLLLLLLQFSASCNATECSNGSSRDKGTVRCQLWCTHVGRETKARHGREKPRCHSR